MLQFFFFFFFPIDSSDDVSLPISKKKSMAEKTKVKLISRLLSN